MLHATRWLHKAVWNCRRRPQLSSVAAGTCQEGLVLCRSHCRAWLWSLKVTKQTTGMSGRHGILNCGFIKGFCTCFFNFFSYATGFNTFFFFSSLANTKSFGSLFWFVFKNLLPVMCTQKHCALHESCAHQKLYSQLFHNWMKWAFIFQSLFHFKEEQLSKGAKGTVCIMSASESTH